MAAPKGNQFWMLRSKHGRDKLFARLKRYGRRRANISNGVMKTHGQQERLYNVPCLLDAKKVKEQKLLMNSKHNKKFHLHSAPTLSPDYVSI